MNNYIVESTNGFHPRPNVNNLSETLESIKSFGKHENIQRIKVSCFHSYGLPIAYYVSEEEFNKEVLNLSHKKGIELAISQ